MACLDETKEINGRTYYVVQMPPTEAIKVQLQLTKIFGDSFGELGSSMNGDFAGQAQALGAAMSLLFKNSDEDEILALVKKVVSTAKVDGKKIVIDSDFTGEYLQDIYKVFFWVLGVNFSSFFGESGLNGFLDKFKVRIMEKLNQKKPVKSEQVKDSQTTSRPT